MSSTRRRPVLVLVATVLCVAVAGGAWYLHGKQPQRDGAVHLDGLQAPVSVRYDARGVPFIEAQNQADLYRALGYVQAQDRLFQMEVARRLARGELAEVLGPRLVDMDKLFRTLRIRQQAARMAARQDRQSPAWQALQAYLDGVNQFQASHPAPLEFDLLGIPKRAFTAEDTFSIAGYLAYSFAAAFRSEPLMTYMRDELGADYLRPFDQPWQPQGALGLSTQDWRGLQALARLGDSALAEHGLSQFEGSNAWAVSGSRTRNGKPLLAGDPHIRFSVPAVWYEAHLSAPGFELYGYHQALNPFAFLGHNRDFGWSLTMFQNDDVDLIAEKLNPDNDQQVWYRGGWVDLQRSEELISVKGAEPVRLELRSSPHGPLINGALGDQAGKTPIALWWAFLTTDNPVLEGFYAINRADRLEAMRAAAAMVHAPGLNLVWANARGDIGWWAAAKLPVRPAGVNPAFILDGSTAEADKNGFYPFERNPQEENPPRGYIVSANAQPAASLPVPGYYNLADRGQQLDRQLAEPGVRWDTDNTRALQLGESTGYGPRTLAPLLEVLREQVSDPGQRQLLEALAQWRGDYSLPSVSATLFNQLAYDLTRAAMHDELGDSLFDALLATRALDSALPRLMADADSPWWDDRGTPQREGRTQIVARAWAASIAHLTATFGPDPTLWQWGKAHTLTQGHPLGSQRWLAPLFNVGPFPAPGGHEVPNNLSSDLGPAPWPVTYGPSTRRIIDFADPTHALTINPVGQSGVLFDRHYADQAEAYVQGRYVRLGEQAVHDKVLRLEPAAGQ